MGLGVEREIIKLTHIIYIHDIVMCACTSSYWGQTVVCLREYIHVMCDCVCVYALYMTLCVIHVYSTPWSPTNIIIVRITNQIVFAYINAYLHV